MSYPLKLAKPMILPAVTVTEPARFPEIRSKDLNGRAVTLPQDIPADRTVVILGWQRNQQGSIDGWVKALTTADAATPWIEVPVIDRSNPLFRMIVNSGMRRGIADHEIWAHVVTLYTDKRVFDQALAVTSEDKVQALVIDRSGTVHERIVGDYTPEGAIRIREALQKR